MQTGYGVLGFITDHGYLDNPTFRGMRQALMRDFDKIYLLDLHGNSRKKEKTPAGDPDKNVFDIQQGVAIGIFVKSSQNNEQPARVFHAELWGERKEKYQWLLENELTTTTWKELKPQTPFYLFMPQDGNLKKEYEAGWKITEIMPVNVLGFQTHRDNFAISFDKKIIEQRLLDMLDPEIADLDLARKYGLRNNRD